MLVTSLAGAVPTIGLSRRHGGRRLTDEARAAWAIEKEPKSALKAEVYGDLTTLMAFHVDVLASRRCPFSHFAGVGKHVKGRKGRILALDHLF